VKDKPSGTQASAVRRSWAECQPQPTVAGDPESGCS